LGSNEGVIYGQNAEEDGALGVQVRKCGGR